MKFELKHIDDLTPKDFINHSIWAQYYSGDEIDFIRKKVIIEKKLNLN